MGIKEGGKTMIMGGTGPMGLLAIDYALHGPIKPKTLVVTARSNKSIEVASKLFPIEEAKKEGVDLYYINISEMEDMQSHLQSIVNEEGYDDVFVFVPVQELVTLASSILAKDGCVNFFAGPQDPKFTAAVNFYDIHYSFTHYVGTSGGNTEDMRQAIQLIESKNISVEKIVTHILGLNAVNEAILDLPNISGGKKLTYTNKRMPLISIEEIQNGKNPDPFYQDLRNILHKHKGLWSEEAEQYVLKFAESIC